jgi:two-component system, LytTR family, response regulator
MIKAIVVDDEAASRNVLRSYLEKYCTDVQVVAEADSVSTALTAIGHHAPDVVFLDVEMPHGNGFDLLEQLGTKVNFETVFVTAFDHYALQALNFSAAHYLLKPVSIEELEIAVEKIRQRRDAHTAALRAQVLIENRSITDRRNKKIVLPLLDGFEVVKADDVIVCVANDNFTDFHLVGKPRKMICRTLKFYEELLEGCGFMRVHKSYLVNLEHVVKYTKGKGGELMMADGTSVPVSPQKKDALMEYFGTAKG